MNNIRVLKINDDECVLFNAFEKRISGPCPAVVGQVVHRMARGEDLLQAMKQEKVEENLYARISSIITYISGTLSPQQEAPDTHIRTFHRTLVLCPSSTCNLRCIYCSGCAGEKTNTFMSWPLARESIDYFFNHSAPHGPYTLQFHGAGEPLNNFDIVKKSIEYAKKIAAEKQEILLTRVSTNGVLTTEQAEWVAKTFDHVSLSIDGPADIHNRQRPGSDGRGSYDSVVRTMKILEKGGALKRLNTVITPYGLTRMDEILKHIRTLTNVRDIRLLPMSYCGRCESNGIPKLDTIRFEEELQKNLPLAKALNFNVLSVLEQVNYYTRYYCGACGFNMCVSPNGKISTCIEVLDENDPGADELLIGNQNKETGEIQINWDKVFKLRDRTYEVLPECMECTFRTNCAGSCLVRAARKNGTVMSVDPESCKLVRGTLGKYFLEMAKEGMNEINQESRELPLSDGTSGLSFKEAVDLSIKVIRAFDEIEERPWTVETTMIELMKQVGDLSKRLMMYENYYFTQRAGNPNYTTSKEKIANELADIFHCLVRIADHYGIDLEDAHIKARKDEIGYIRSIAAARAIKQ
jgi:uncharacterized protein